MLFFFLDVFLEVVGIIFGVGIVNGDLGSFFDEEDLLGGYQDSTVCFNGLVFEESVDGTFKYFFRISVILEIDIEELTFIFFRVLFFRGRQDLFNDYLDVIE